MPCTAARNWASNCPPPSGWCSTPQRTRAWTCVPAAPLSSVTATLAGTAATTRRSCCAPSVDALPVTEDTGLPFASRTPGADARLRPRRPHGDAGGRRAAARRAAGRARRARGVHVPARRGGPSMAPA
ncbi:hypothetical protein LT493_08965 [Streptomyces tricolor]|nr:hypothetical protein [Streptomyces tricolor]